MISGMSSDIKLSDTTSAVQQTLASTQPALLTSKKTFNEYALTSKNPLSPLAEEFIIIINKMVSYIDSILNPRVAPLLSLITMFNTKNLFDKEENILKGKEEKRTLRKFIVSLVSHSNPGRFGLSHLVFSIILLKKINSIILINNDKEENILDKFNIGLFITTSFILAIKLLDDDRMVGKDHRPAIMTNYSQLINIPLNRMFALEGCFIYLLDYDYHIGARQYEEELANLLEDKLVYKDFIANLLKRSPDEKHVSQIIKIDLRTKPSYLFQEEDGASLVSASSSVSSSASTMAATAVSSLNALTLTKNP